MIDVVWFCCVAVCAVVFIGIGLTVIVDATRDVIGYFTQRIDR